MPEIDIGNNDKEEESPPDFDDNEAWVEATRDITPLKCNGIPKGIIRAKNSIAIRGYPCRNYGNLPKSSELDKNTDDRLRKGLLPLEARLDLHCMTQNQAYAALQKFINQGYEKGRRCVLVITGTGSRHPAKDIDKPWYEQSPGVLRERVPQWLREGEMTRMVLRFYPAQRRHGGDGAYYVLIRRKR